MNVIYTVRIIANIRNLFYSAHIFIGNGGFIQLWNSQSELQTIIYDFTVNNQFTMSSATDICLYGSAWVGMLASIVDTTNVECILQLDCNATDFYSTRKYPTYLLFNPYFEAKEVTLNQHFTEPTDLYDLVSQKIHKEKLYRRNKHYPELGQCRNYCLYSCFR